LNALIFGEYDFTGIISDKVKLTNVYNLDSALAEVVESEFDIVIIIDQDISFVSQITEKCKQLAFYPLIIFVSDNQYQIISDFKMVLKSSLSSALPFIIETADVSRKKRLLIQDLNRLGNFFSNLRTDEYTELKFMNEVLTQLNLLLINQHDFNPEKINSFLYQRNLDDLPVVRAANGELTYLINQQLPDTFIFSSDPDVSTKSQAAQISIPFKWNGEIVGGLYIEISDVLPDKLKISDFYTLISSFIGSTGIYDLVSVDTTTRVLTRRFVLQRLYEELKSSYRANHNLTMLMMDLDKFKLINDINGHPAGDKILREIGVLLHESARESDIIGRYGGDEFIIILPETEINGGSVLAHRIRERIRKLGAEHPLGVNELDISIGICGIVQNSQDDNHSSKHRMTHENFQCAMNSLIAIADDAMYQAKISVYEKVKSYEAITWEHAISSH